MSDKVKIGVIGVGHLGQHHVRVYSELPGAELVGVFDVHRAAAERAVVKSGARVFDTAEALADACDALSIVTPTKHHFEVASALLQRGKHLLVEKPITDNGAQAEQLVRLAQARKLVLQVGHVERFNPVLKYLEQVAAEPRFIEAHRLSPHPGRSTDIGVVLDLMIHDLDVILYLVKSPLVSVDAVGVPVLSASEDIANARLRFANGCVANLTCSRVSAERLRKIRLFTSTSYLSLDYMRQEGQIYRIARADEDVRESGLLAKLLATAGAAATVVSQFAGKTIIREPVPIEKGEPLKLELASFVAAVRDRRAPEVSGEQAKRALDVALAITEQIRSGR